MELPMLWSGLILLIHVLGEIANELIAAASGACICWCPISPIDSIACKGHLNMEIKNALNEFISFTTLFETGGD